MYQFSEDLIALQQRNNQFFTTTTGAIRQFTCTFS